jgi:peptide/nickel transport system substrate-binding protein
MFPLFRPKSRRLIQILRSGLGAVTAITLLLALAACDPPSAAPEGGGAIRVAFSDAMDSLDPIMNIDSRVIQLSIFDSLTETKADGSLGPQLARSWSSNADATVWTFTITADAKWPDGSAVTADDVLFTFNTIMNTPTSPNKPYLETVKRIEKTGDNEIQFTLRHPFASWPRQLTLISVVPRKIYQAMGATAFAEKPVGSGPYRVTTWQRGGELALTANPNYWGGAPDIAKVTYVPVPDGVARFNGIQSGDLDIVALTPQQVALAKQFPNISVTTTPSNKVVYLGFNVTNPALNAKLRQAAGYAIDRRTITQYLLHGLSQPIGQLVAQVSFGYDPSVEATPYDPEKAKSLVVESGYSGEPIIFEYPTDGVIPLPNQLAQAIEGYLQAAGINLRMRGMDQRSLAADWIAKKMQGMYMFSYNPSTMDAELVTGSLFAPTGVGYFNDPIVNALEEQQQAQADQTERAATLGRLWRYNKEQAYYLPLINDTYTYASVAPKVRFTPRADGYILPQDLHKP